MKKMRKLLVAGALSLLLLAETASAIPAAAADASGGQPGAAASAKTYNASALTPTPMPMPIEQPDIARTSYNQIIWIKPGATYRSGATLQFYATGDGYSPADPQELNPIKNSTRYIPVSWSVGSKRGSWKEKDREVTTGGTRYDGSYTLPEYRFKDSFTLNTNSSAGSVPFTLKVIYQKQTYDGKKWVKNAGATDTKKVKFYIRNVDTSAPGPSRPTVGTRYIRGNVVYRVTGNSTVTATAPAERSIKNLIIPASIQINGYYFKVKAIAKDAFSGCPNLKTASIGENVTTIGKNAFKNSKKLGIVALHTTKLTKSKVGANAFKGIKSNCLFKTPSWKTAAYKKLVQSKGAGKKVRVKTYF